MRRWIGVLLIAFPILEYRFVLDHADRHKPHGNPSICQIAKSAVQSRNIHTT